MNLLEDYLRQADLSTAPVMLREFRPAGSLLVTPRYEDSRHVIALLLDSSSQPRIVGKIVRRPDDRSTLATEFEVLQKLATLSADARTAPRPLAFVQHHGHWMLIETAVNGVILTHRRVRKAPTRSWSIVDRWLRSLPITGNTSTTRWFNDQITAPLNVAVSMLRATQAERRMFAATKRILRPLTSASLPMPLEHGDLSHPNLLLSRGRLGVVDWETGRVHGVPGADAAVFLAFMAFARDGAHGLEPEAAAYGRHFLSQDGQGRQLLKGHLERAEIDPKWLDLILLATWTRYALHVFPRLAPRGETDPEDRIDLARQLFRGGRSLRLWRMTLEHIVD
jgi:aminoglycoside phosphotransferase (APT) family kinase protein